MNHLSVVNIIHSDHVVQINELAEMLGMGSDSLSIKLSDGVDIYYGCHSWWNLDSYIIFKDYDALIKIGIDVTKYKPVMNALKEFVINTKDMGDDEVMFIPDHNWQTALNDLGLTLFVNT